MEAAGCCLMVIIGLVLWGLFLALAGALPALGLLTALMLWSSGHRDVSVVIIALSLGSALAGTIMYDRGFSGPSFISSRALAPALFVALQAALPAGILMSLTYLKFRRDFEDPRINTSVNVIIVITALVVLLFILGKSFDV